MRSVANVVDLPAAWAPGLAVAGRLLRAGIVLLGFRLSPAGALALGLAAWLLVASAAYAGTVLTT